MCLRNCNRKIVTKKCKIMKIVSIVLFWMMMCSTSLSLFAQSKAGVAQVNITPPVGYAHYRGVSSAVNDSLYAKALVVGEGENRFGWVVCDLLWIERDLSTAVRLKA